LTRTRVDQESILLVAVGQRGEAVGDPDDILLDTAVAPWFEPGVDANDDSRG
jgi:hypothetical protein